MKGMIIILEDILQEKLKNKCEKNIDDYVQLVANWFGYVILNNKKHKIDHSIDPPWDHSGRVFNTDEPFDLNDYATFDEFINEEYTGESCATYMSGYGIAHYTYEERFNQISFEWLTSQVHIVIEELIENNNSYLEKWIENENITFDIKEADNITDLIVFEDIIGDFIYSYSLDIEDYLLKTHPIILFNRGKKEALIKIRKEKKKQMENQKKYQKNREKAEYLWDKILKIFKLKYGEKIPKKINKPLYDSKVKQLLIELHKNGSNVDEIQKIGKYLGFNFSNSVELLISKFEVPEKIND
jgi:hypothetical protein